MRPRFAVGDRVCVTQSLSTVAADSLGTVIYLYPATPGFYGVQLDGEWVVRIFTDSLLMPAGQPQGPPNSED